jgi:general secretion pathway protein G
MFWFVDNTGTSSASKQFDLEGDQCLVFFLGGIAERRGPNDFILHGFTNDQTNPSRIADSGTPITMSRTPSLFNFDTTRLYVRSDYPNLIEQNPRLAEQSYGTTITDFYPNGANPGTAGYLGRLPSYKVMNADSSNPLPVAYFSAYEGRGYRPDDLNIPEAVTVDPNGDGIYFQLVWPVITKTNDDSTYPTQRSLEPNPYTRGPAGLGTNGSPLRASTTVIQPYANKTYQIILPGPDNQFGAGGSQADYSGTGWTENADNLASFTSGLPVGEFVTQQQK